MIIGVVKNVGVTLREDGAFIVQYNYSYPLSTTVIHENNNPINNTTTTLTPPGGLEKFIAESLKTTAFEESSVVLDEVIVEDLRFRSYTV